MNKPTDRLTIETPDGTWLRVSARLAVWPDEIEERFVRASGPGGQNVNKVSTAVQLRFHTDGARDLPEEILTRLKTLAGRRLDKEGVLTIDARRYRTQEQNREDARQRLEDLLRAAALRPTPRVPTKVSRAAKKRRVADKRRRASVKHNRRSVPFEE